MPAGMIDKGETTDDAARRELREETGFTAMLAPSAAETKGSATSTMLLPTSLCWPDPWKSSENYYVRHY